MGTEDRIKELEKIVSSAQEEYNIKYNSLAEKLINLENKVDATLKSLNQRLDQTARRNGELGFYIGKKERFYSLPDCDNFIILYPKDNYVPNQIKDGCKIVEKDGVKKLKYFSERSTRIMKACKNNQIQMEEIIITKPVLIGYKKVRKSKYNPIGILITKVIEVDTCYQDIYYGIEDGYPYKIEIDYYAMAITNMYPKYGKVSNGGYIYMLQDKWVIDGICIHPGEGYWLYKPYDRNTICKVLTSSCYGEYEAFDLNMKYLGKLDNL